MTHTLDALDDQLADAIHALAQAGSEPLRANELRLYALECACRARALVRLLRKDDNSYKAVAKILAAVNPNG